MSCLALVSAAAAADLNPTPAGTAGRAVLTGRVLSGHRSIAGATVRLYRTPNTRSGGRPRLAATARTGANGAFALSYPRQRGTYSVGYLIASDGGRVRFAAALGTSPLPTRVVVDDRTTAATGFALAQFVRGDQLVGRAPGLQNGAAMVRDLVSLRTGRLSSVLSSAPNGSRTSTLRTFNSLANVLAQCARSRGACDRVLRLAGAPGQRRPRGLLQAVADIARNPWHRVKGLFALSKLGPTPYQPALRSSRSLDAWTLALRFDGDGKTMSGPGNMAIDARGNVWATNNYVYSRNPAANVCGSNLLLEFSPTGAYVAGSPFSGGGLNGAGFGITLDPRGHVWVGNFGFSAAKCVPLPPSNSVSEFTGTGTPLSPSATSTSTGGFTQGGVKWPQGTVSDRSGNIWIANCGNDTITQYPSGNPNRAKSFPLAIKKPFDIAFNRRGQAFVTGDGSDAVEMLNRDGSPALAKPITGGGLDKPMGIATDLQGNMWVADSGFADVPCPTGSLPSHSHPAALTLIRSNGHLASRQPFTGGGLTAPWGVAVDGHDNVWVANFGGQRLSEFCGLEIKNCPRGSRTGKAISPETGYGFNGLTRNTGVQVDPTGNVWVANNWKTNPLPKRNPGGYQMVVFLGLAGPLKTPLIGTPVPLQ